MDNLHLSDELKKNLAAFESRKVELESTDWNRIAVFHDGELVSIYNDEGDAYSIACEKFGLGHFSLHRIGERPVSLGSHTMFMKVE